MKRGLKARRESRQITGCGQAPYLIFLLTFYFFLVFSNMKEKEMKKYQMMIFLVFSSALLIMIGCKENEFDNLEGALTIHNLPEGDVFVRVLHNNTPQENLKPDSANYLATGKGPSPIRLLWMEAGYSGVHYVIVTIYTGDVGTNSRIVKITTATFSKNGDATLDYNDMTDLTR